MLFYKIFIRSIRLFTLGMLIFSMIGSNIYDFKKIRIPGVLQRISICYLITCLVETYFYKSVLNRSSHFEWKRCVTDFIRPWQHVLLQVIFVSSWMYCTFLLEVPSCPTGYMEPGGLHNLSKHHNCTGGYAGYLDRILFGSNHLYQRGSIKNVYKNEENFDPEGVLGTLSALFLTFLGIQAGKIILVYKLRKHQIFIWICWGLFVFIIFLQLKTKIPVNKNLWTITFTLITGSSSFFIMSLLYYIIDIKKYWSGSPFIYLGTNSIIIYISHFLFSKTFPVYWNMPNTHSNKLFMNLWGCFFWTLVAFIFDYKNIKF